MENRVPRIVFAVGPGIDANLLRQAFASEGFATDFANNAEELALLLASNDVFLIYLASDFGGGGSRVILEFKRRTKAVWVILSRTSIARDRTKFFNLGASECMKYPAPPTELLTRAQNILVRYLRAQSFDPAVTLPAYLSAPKEAPVTVLSRAAVAAPPPELKTVAPALEPESPAETLEFERNRLRGGDLLEADFGERLKGYSTVENALRHIVRERANDVVYIPKARPWKPERWPANHLPPKDHKHFKNVGNSIQRCRSLFEETRKVLGAERIILFSIEAPESGDTFSSYVLVSSDPHAPRTNEKANAEWYPQLFGAERAQRGMYFNFAFDQSLAPKPESWALNRAGESSSAALNVLDERGIKAAILVEFSDLDTEAPLELLAEAETFLREPSAEYRNIDFLCRVYRRANLPVDL